MSRSCLIPGARTLVAALVVATSCTSGSAGPGTRPPTAASLSPASVASSAPANHDGLTLLLDGGAPLSASGVVVVTITAPAGTTEAQVTTDASFADVVWQPLAEAKQITIVDAGYQMVFARVRSGTGPASAPVVAGIDVDPTYAAATASQAKGAKHRASWAGLVAPDVLQVRVETGRVVRQGDAPNDAMLGRSLDVGPLDDAAGYLLSGATVARVSRVSRPYGEAHLQGGEKRWPMIHDLFLVLDAPLSLGTAHTLTFPGGDVDDLAVTIDANVTLSPALHVNQVGYAPNDDGKIAQLSAWTGAPGGIHYPAERAFHVVDASSASAAFDGTTTLRRPTAGGEVGRGDLTGAEVHEADFSAVRTPGRYRLCVDGIGCSTTFAISVAGSWRRGAIAVARAMYHQRSGSALDEPFTSVARPRPFHPDDGVVFHQTTLTMVDDPAHVGKDDRFDEYAAADTGTVVAGAWGGHFDAGDWNSRIQHLDYLRAALDLVRLYPGTFARLSLDIPKSGDAIPDVIDEGLWDLDHFHRLQTADGGVPGNVDQARFADAGETSWHNSIDVYVFAPDVWSTYIYAGVAAQAAVVLRTYDAARAAAYGESAKLAMAWADRHWAELGANKDALAPSVVPRRAVAAAAMLQLTGDEHYNDVFAESTAFAAGPADLDGAGPLGDAAWLYAIADSALTRPALRANAIESLRRNADAALVAQTTTAYSWLLESPGVPFVYGLGPSIPHGVGVLRAFVVTGDQRYRTAMVRAASFSLGSNPLNVSFATGLGSSPATYPLMVDNLAGGLPVTPGTFVYGIHDLKVSETDDWVEKYFLKPAGTHPDAADVPLLRSWYDVGSFPMMNEFTVNQSHASALWTLGVLAAT